MGFITKLLNSVLSLFGDAIISLLNLLPNTPFSWNLNGTNEALTWVQWLFPISGFVTTVGLYVTAVAGYYSIRAALRWIKVVGS